MLSLPACQRAARDFEALFDGTYRSPYWRMAGDTRRDQPSDHLVHVVIPKAASGADVTNAVWERGQALLSRGTLSLWERPGEFYFAPSTDSSVAWFSLRGVRHEVYLATDENWASRLVEHTGPPGYWRMLMHRLKMAGALTLHHGNVCVIDRSVTPYRLEPIPCKDEVSFFLLCRTAFKAPAYRFERPEGHDNVRDWERGVLAPWYPLGTRVYADPRQTWLFDTGRATKPRYVGRDSRKWRHT